PGHRHRLVGPRDAEQLTDYPDRQREREVVDDVEARVRSRTSSLVIASMRGIRAWTLAGVRARDTRRRSLVWLGGFSGSMLPALSWAVTTAVSSSAPPALAGAADAGRPVPRHRVHSGLASLGVWPK